MLMLACSVRAESPSGLPRVDQARVVYMFEPGTKLVLGQDNSVSIDQEVQPKHDECRPRYAHRELPFPIRRLRNYTQRDLFLPAWVELQGADGCGRSWFLNEDYNLTSKSYALQLWRLQAGVLRQWPLEGGYHHDTELKALPSRWPWIGTDMLVDADGTAWVVGAKRLYRFPAGAQEGDQPEAIPFPEPARRDQAEDLFGRSPYWCQQTYRFGGEVWVVRQVRSNCHSPGAFVLRFGQGQSSLVAWLPNQYVGGLIWHGGSTSILVESGESSEGKPLRKPITILQVGQDEPPVQPEELVRRKIAELDDDSWSVRNEASKFLARLPNSQLDLLRKAIDKDASLEQKHRLRLALQAAVVRYNRAAPTRLEGVAAARLVLIGNDGRQYVQPYHEGHPKPELLVFDGRTCQRIDLPAENFTLDCQGDDGCLYGHTSQALYVREGGRNAWRPLASLDGLAGQEIHVLGVWKGLVCLGVNVYHDYRWSSVPVWLDFSSADPLTPLPGKPIAEGIVMKSTDVPYCPVAVGPGNRLWFLRYDPANHDPQWHSLVKVNHTQICRAIGSEARNLTGMLATSIDPSVWPTGLDTAMVVTGWGHEQPEQVLFYDQGKASTHATMAELVEKHFKRLQETMADGDAFRVGDEHDPICLIRLGDTFYVQESRHRRHGNGSGMWAICSIIRDGRTVKRQEGSFGHYRPIVERLVGADARTGRLLGFVEDCKTLKWIPLASNAADDEVVCGGSDWWGWCWRSRTALPRMAGVWTLTPAASEQMRAVTPERVEEARRRGVSAPDVFPAYRSADLPAWRRWDHGQWRTISQSLYGSELSEDGAGCLWVFREREVEIFFPGGSRQIIPLDAGAPGLFHLAIESPEAVWVASQQSLKRFRLERDTQDQPAHWTANGTFRLPNLGVGFVGPWIAGEDFYYVCNKRLFQTTLEELNGQPLVWKRH